MGPPDSPILQVPGDVGERRIVGGQTSHPRSERGRDARQRSTLASARDREIEAVPLRVAGEKVVGANAAEIYPAVIIAIAVVETKDVVVQERSRTQGVVDRLLHRDRDTVNPDL